ncbi:MAG: hypothetical protein VW741_03555 [Flammeovirgaceae bacterium]
MYSLLNISYLYIFMGTLCIVVYFNIPADINSEFLSRWILLLSIIYYVLGISRLRRHLNQKNKD